MDEDTVVDGIHNSADHRYIGEISSTEQYPRLDLSRKIITLGNTKTVEMLSEIEEVAYQAAREVGSVETKSEARRRLDQDDEPMSYNNI